MFGIGFNSDKLSVKCQLCVKRMHLVRNKKRMQIHALKAEIAEMMRTNQDVNARIKVEEVIRQEWLISVYSTLETYLILLQTRAGMLKKSKEPPPDMLEAINTIFFAAERVKYELDEMPAIADMLMTKFRSALCDQFNTKEFAKDVVEDHCALKMLVKETVVAGLSVFPAKGDEKLAKCEQIAKDFGVAEFNVEEYRRELILVNPRMPTKPVVNAHPINTDTADAYTYVAQPATKPTHTFTAAAPAPAPAAAAPSVPLAPGAFGPRIPDPFANIPSNPPTRPTGVSRASSKKDPWAPLPPQKVNLGYGFSERLDSVAQNMAGKRTSSADTGSLASGGGSQDFNVAGRAGSVTSAAPAAVPQEQEDVLVETVEGSDLPQVPNVASKPPSAAEEEDLVARLARLKDANPNRVLLQQPTTDMETSTMQQPMGGAGSQLHVEPPMTEEMLANFDLYLTPSPETMQSSQTLLNQLNNPEQFKQWVDTNLNTPDGINVVAAVFSDLIAKNQAMRLSMALNQAYGQQQQQTGISAQTGGSAPSWQPWTAYNLAIVDQITRGDVQRAGEAIYWGLSTGSADQARSVIAGLDSLQARLGCTDPLKSAFMFATQFAQMQMNNPTGTNPSRSFFDWINQSKPLMACFESSSPQFASMMQQAQGEATTETQTGGMAGQP